MSIPKPKVPVLPVIDWPGRFPRRTKNLLCKAAFNNIVPVSSGTEAIILALLHSGIAPGEEVLVPGYHCPTMLSAIRAAGAVPRTIRISDSLDIDLQHASQVISPRTSAMLLPSYFGFPQDAENVLRFCKQNSLALIHDCAHVFPSTEHLRRIAEGAHYVVLSAPKFYPTGSGGFLLSLTRDLSDAATVQPTLLANLKSLVNCLEQAASYDRLRPFGRLIAAAAGLGTRLSAKINRVTLASMPTPHENKSLLNFPVQRDWRHTANGMSFTDSLIVRFADDEMIAQKRRMNFQFLLDSLSETRGGKPLFDRLPNGVVPYMFPFVIDNPQRHFLALKLQGVPIYRWDEIEPGECEVSRRYSQKLIQLPCHQSLRQEELDWLTNRIRRQLLQDS